MGELLSRSWTTKDLLDLDGWSLISIPWYSGYRILHFHMYENNNHGVYHTVDPEDGKCSRCKNQAPDAVLALYDFASM